MKDGEIKKYIKQTAKEVSIDIKRQMGAYKEEMHGYVKAVAEQHLDLKKTLDEHTEKIDNLTMDMREVKMDMKDIRYNVNLGLDRKVDKKHFVELDGRVRKLEAKA